MRLSKQISHVVLVAVRVMLEKEFFEKERNKGNVRSGHDWLSRDYGYFPCVFVCVCVCVCERNRALFPQIGECKMLQAHIWTGQDKRHETVNIQT